MSNAHARGIGGGLFGKESQANYDVYLNLTPLMDVMSNILFFLMASFGASAVAIIAVTVPIDSSADFSPSDTPPEDKVTVTLQAEADGLTLGCTNPAKRPDELKVCAQKVGMVEGKYDLAGLSAGMRRIKGAFAGATTVIVTAHDRMPYQVLVGILDVTRDLQQPDGTRLPLFADVVLSSLVK